MYIRISGLLLTLWCPILSPTPPVEALEAESNAHKILPLISISDSLSKVCNFFPLGFKAGEMNDVFMVSLSLQGIINDVYCILEGMDLFLFHREPSAEDCNQ